MGEPYMKTVLLAGGLGSRLAEETVRIPKPMVEVASRPIMMHVMDIYSHWGHNDFIVACGYKCLLQHSFFQDLHLINNDFTVALKSGGMPLRRTGQIDWNVSAVGTRSDERRGGQEGGRT